MNDDFLYRLRTEPPEHFATQLKDRLDRSATRKARAWQAGLLLLLFSTAFAVVSPTVRMSVAEVIDWIRGAPPAMADAKQPVPVSRESTAEVPAAAMPATSNDIQGAAAEEAARDGARALLEAIHAERLRRGTQSDSVTTQDSSDGTHASTVGNAAQDATTSGDADAESGFIVTGPLLDEYGTPAQIFHARRGYFNAMSWYMDRLNTMAASRARIGVESARTAVHRLEVLAPMLPEFFALDERTTTVITRADRRIWEQPAEFERETNMFLLALRVLDASLASGNIDEQGVRARIVLVGRVCAGCHEKFRKQGNKDVGAVTP